MTVIATTSDSAAITATDDIEAACEDFRRFVRTWTPPDGREKEQVCLEDLLAAWLCADGGADPGPDPGPGAGPGAGVGATAADYDRFLHVVLRIIDGVLNGTLCLDYRGTATAPYVRWLVGLERRRHGRGHGGNVLSRTGYDRLVRRTLAGGHPYARADGRTRRLRVRGRSRGPRKRPRRVRRGRPYAAGWAGNGCLEKVSCG